MTEGGEQSRADGGYGLIAAITAVLAFSLLALQVLTASRGNVALASAEIEKARLTAAANAGLAAAIVGLSDTDTATRWPIDGRRRAMTFNNIALSIVVEDERGKIPINLLGEDQVRTMFEVAGVSGERLDTLVDSFEDWIDDDDDPRPHGAEASYYAQFGIKPRNGALRTPDELLSIKGMDQSLYAKLAPAITVFFGESGGFSTSTAQPLAIAVMVEGGLNSPAYIERQREMAGDRPALDMEDAPLTGRPLTVRVLASDGTGGRFERSAIVELTGNPQKPYWIRWVSR